MQIQSQGSRLTEKDFSDRPEVVIRKADSGDAEVLAELIGQLGYPTRADEMPPRLRHLLSRSEDYLVAVAQRQGLIIGVIAAALGFYIERNGPHGRVTALSVDESHRREGVGALLLAHAEAWLRSRGAVACIINSQTRRADAHRFYAREGYEVTGLRFHKDL